MLDHARASVMRAMAQLDACIARIGDMIEAGDYDVRAASHLAYLTKHAVMNLAEVRKLEAHDQRAVRGMSTEERDELVADYVRDMSPERRRVIHELCRSLDSDGGVLTPSGARSLR